MTPPPAAWLQALNDASALALKIARSRKESARAKKLAGLVLYLASTKSLKILVAVLLLAACGGTKHYDTYPLPPAPPPVAVEPAPVPPVATAPPPAPAPFPPPPVPLPPPPTPLPAATSARGGFANGHLTLGGTPRFALGVYDSGGGYSLDPAFWDRQVFDGRGLRDVPFNVYLNYHLGEMPIAPTLALLDALHARAVMYLQTGNCFEAGSWTRQAFSIRDQAYVQRFAQHPAALGYYIMDECGPELAPETVAHNAQLHAWDPDGVTFAATFAAGYTDNTLWVPAADVLGTDPYPIVGPSYPHFVVADFVSKLRASARADRPVWAVLQFFKFTDAGRMPTPEEMRAHAVMAIVEGTEGLMWWDVGVNGVRALDAGTVASSMSALRSLIGELASLEPALLAPPSAALVGNSTRFADAVAGRLSQLAVNTSTDWLYSRKEWYAAEAAALRSGDRSKSGRFLDGAANVRTLTKIVNGTGYVFAYNYMSMPQPVTFTWAAPPGGVRESRSGTWYPLNGASWSDVIEGYGARIYIVR